MIGVKERASMYDVVLNSGAQHWCSTLVLNRAATACVCRTEHVDKLHHSFWALLLRVLQCRPHRISSHWCCAAVLFIRRTDLGLQRAAACRCESFVKPVGWLCVCFYATMWLYTCIQQVMTPHQYDESQRRKSTSTRAQANTHRWAAPPQPLPLLSP